MSQGHAGRSFHRRAKPAGFSAVGPFAGVSETEANRLACLGCQLQAAACSEADLLVKLAHHQAESPAAQGFFQSPEALVMARPRDMVETVRGDEVLNLRRVEGKSGAADPGHGLGRARRQHQGKSGPSRPLRFMHAARLDRHHFKKPMPQ